MEKTGQAMRVGCTSQWISAILGSSGVLVLAVLAGCRSEPVSWRKPLHGVILFQDSIGWSDLVPDSLWVEGEEGLVLEARSRRSLLDAESLVPDLDTAWTESFTLPFIGGPIPVAPGAEVWSEQETLNFPIPHAGLRRVRLSGGKLTLGVTSTVQGPLELRYTLKGAEFPPEVNGGSNEIVLTVNGDSSEVVLPLDEVKLDLDGVEGLYYNRLDAEWSVGVSVSSPDPVGVFGNDGLSLSLSLSGLSVAQVEGRFDNQQVLLEDTVFLDQFSELQALEVGWSSLDLGLRLHNTSALDFSCSVESVSRLDSGAAGLIAFPLEDPALGAPVFLPRAMVVGDDMASWEIWPNAAELWLSSQAGNLADFLSSIPEAVSWSAGLTVNPLGDVTGGHDRINLESLPELEAMVSAPLEVSTARAVLVDTLEVVPPDWLDFVGQLDLRVENRFPVGATMRMELVELAPGQSILAGVFGPSWWRFEDIEIPPTVGNSEVPSAGEYSVDFIQPHFEALRQGARLRVEIELEAPDQGAQFRVEQGVVIAGHLTGDAIISIQ